MIRGAVQWFSVTNRRRKLERVKRLIRQHDVRSVLLVGVSGAGYEGENLIERGVGAATEFALFTGLVEHTRDRWEPYVVCDAMALPFPDHAFDLVLSNAVIEHVGGEGEQRRFVAEHVRAGRIWVITTPNRWFPIESHTRAVFRHWSPSWRERQVEFTRLLSWREFRALLPAATRLVGTPLGPTFFAVGRR